MISQREPRNQSGEIMRALDHGESFVVTRGGVPVGDLTPGKPRRSVDRAAVPAAFAGAPAVDAERFRAELDGALDQDPGPRA